MHMKGPHAVHNKPFPESGAGEGNLRLKVTLELRLNRTLELQQGQVELERLEHHSMRLPTSISSDSSLQATLCQAQRTPRTVVQGQPYSIADIEMARGSKDREARDRKEKAKHKGRDRPHSPRCRQEGRRSRRGQQNDVWARHARNSTGSMMTTKHESQTPQQPKA